MQALDIAMLLQQIGHDSWVLCTDGSTLANECAKKRINTQAVFTGRKMFHHLGKLVAFLRHVKPDIIHTHHSHDLWLLVPAMHMAGSRAKLFLTKHMASGVKKTDPLHKYLYNRVDAIFAISNYIRQSVINTCPVSEDRVCLLPNAIKLDQYNHTLYDRNEIRAELNIKSDTMVIGMIARMTPGKGHEEFIHAARLIRNVYPLPVCFMIIGGASHGEDRYAESITQLADRLFQENEILFTGFRKDIPRLLMAMDILAFPSHEESFGLVLLEAMAMNLPVVASSGGGVSDIVVNKETGILVKPRDADDLATGLLQLMLNSQKRARFAASGRMRVEQYFSDQKFTNDLLAFYSGQVSIQDMSTAAL